MSERAPTRIGIAGLGTVGREIARRLGEVPGYKLMGVATSNPARAAAFLEQIASTAQLCSFAELAELADVVIECAPAELLFEIASPVLSNGKEVIVLSVGALLDHADLLDLAKSSGGRITVPTGALLGLDAVGAAAEGCIKAVKIITRKPPAGLAGAPHIVESRIDVEDVTEPQLVFSGSAREAGRKFPANLNVAVALALAGVGPDKTEVEVWIDPGVTRNTHLIEVESDSARFSMKMENIPTENPRTGRITALSVISLLRKRTSTLSIGS